MRRLGLACGAALIGALFALAAFALLYHHLLILQALAAGVLSAVAVLVIRTTWAHCNQSSGSVVPDSFVIIRSEPRLVKAWRLRVDQRPYYRSV